MSQAKTKQNISAHFQEDNDVLEIELKGQAVQEFDGEGTDDEEGENSTLQDVSVDQSSDEEASQGHGVTANSEDEEGQVPSDSKSVSTTGCKNKETYG